MRASIRLPEGMNAEIKEDTIIIKKDSDELKKKVNLSGIRITVQDNEVILESDKDNKKSKRLINTIKSHVQNMIKGLTRGYTYKLKACFTHFPITLEKTSTHVIIKNFLGEKKPRKAKIIGDVNIEIKGNEIIITGKNKEHVGQTAANIETTTRIKKYDKRIFQDGVYITEKDGKKL